MVKSSHTAQTLPFIHYKNKSKSRCSPLNKYLHLQIKIKQQVKSTHLYTSYVQNFMQANTISLNISQSMYLEQNLGLIREFGIFSKSALPKTKMRKQKPPKD